MSKEEKTEKHLSIEQLGYLGQVAVEAFNQELLRVYNSGADEVKSFILRRNSDTSFYTFFTEQALENLVNEVLESVNIRDFVMNLTERVVFNLACEDLDFNDVAKTLSKAISLNKPIHDVHVIVVREIVESVTVGKDTLNLLFTKNSWVLVLYILLMNFHQTELWQEYLKTLTS